MDGGAGRCDLHFRLDRFFDFPINAPNRPAHSLSCGLPCGSGGVYSLLRTSNPGARALQNLPLARAGRFACGKPQNFALYQSLAESLLHWREEQQILGLGAVVGATSPKELEQLATLYGKRVWGQALVYVVFTIRKKRAACGLCAANPCFGLRYSVFWGELFTGACLCFSQIHIIRTIRAPD